MNENREYRLEHPGTTVLFRLLETLPDRSGEPELDLWIVWTPPHGRRRGAATVRIHRERPGRDDVNGSHGLCLGVERNGADNEAVLFSGREILVSEEVAEAFLDCYEILRGGAAEAVHATAHELWARLEGYLVHLAGQLRRLPGRSVEHRLGIFARLEAARRHLENDLKSDRCVTEAAERASMSRSHFIRTFKAFYGETPKQVRIARRLQLAKRLLRHSRLSVAEIAVQTGFGNRCAFHRLFRERLGETPMEYRERGDPL